MLRVNEREIPFQEGESLDRLLVRCDFDSERVAVEVNGELIRRANFKDTFLEDGAKVEVFSFVGGG